MKTENNTNRAELGPFLGAACNLIDRHPRAASGLLWLATAATVAAVLFYDFTTNL